MNTVIKDRGVSGISLIAEADGAECIAETEVLLFRGQEVPEDAMKLYTEYVKGKTK